MTAVVSTRCRGCHAELTDRFSRMIGWGPKCREDMTPDQLADALRANQPGYTPKAPQPPASTQARRNHLEVARLTAPEPEAKVCAAHGGIPATCALCRRDKDPKRITDRIIAIFQRMPMDQRIAAQRATAIRRYNPDLAARQLTIGA